MQNKLIVGAGAGAVAAALYVTALALPALGVLSLFFSALPLFVAGLGWGLVPTAVAGTVAALLVGALVAPVLAVNFAAAFAVPVTLFIYLALMRRRVTDADGAPAVEWYPAGRLLAALSFVAAGFLIGAAIATAGEGGLQAAARSLLLELFGGQKGLEEILEKGGSTLSAEQYIDVLSAAFPAIAGMSFVAQMAANAGLAQRLLARRGLALRPSPSVRRLSLPFSLDIALAGAMVLSFLPGEPGFVAASLTALFLLPYFLLGLVVVHVISTGWPSRALVLIAVYLSLIVLSFTAVFIAVLGLIETCFGLRRRYAVAAPPT